jgi:hypothetical protein
LTDEKNTKALVIHEEEAPAVQENVADAASDHPGAQVAGTLDDVTPDDGEAGVIVGIAAAAKHIYTAALEALPEPNDSGFASGAAVVLSGLRKLEAALSEAACRSRATSSVIVALSDARRRYDDLMARAADSPGSTLGQRLYTVRARAKLSALETANGAGLQADLLEAVEADETTTYDVATKVEALIAELGG